jgi:5'-nucleotidase
MNQRPAILLTNDDGWSSPGLRSLHAVLDAEYDVTVAAPSREQSGIGHAFTFNRPVRYAELPKESGIRGYSIDGTPSDCVKFAISHLLSRVPDLVVSGMNIGENSGISGHYSGTVAAAREGAFWRVPSIAFSLCVEANEHLDAYCRRAPDILRRIVKTGPGGNGRCIFYNVNFPGCAPSACRGIKVTRQSMAFFDDRYRRVTADGATDGYVVYGDKKDIEALDTFDSRALLNGYITVTPLSFDATAEWALPLLAGLEGGARPHQGETT